MHELSIAQNLLSLCEQNLQLQNATEVVAIYVKLGRLSGVEAHYLQSAFDVVKAGSVCENAQLFINMQSVVVACKSCGAQSELDKNEFLCPKCGLNELEILDGEDMMLMRLEIR